MPARRRPLRFWTWGHRLTAAVFLTLLILGRQDWFPWLKGAATSTRLAGIVPLADPLAGLEVMLAARHATATLLVGVAMTLLLAAVCGRVFCGWLCPLGLVLELSDSLRLTLRRWSRSRYLRLPLWSVPESLKYWLLAFVLLLSLFSGLPVFTTISPINLLVVALVFAPGAELAVVGALIVFEWSAPRAFCRAICPVGALYGIVGRFAPWRMWVRGEEAGKVVCRQCTLHCPMGIRVLEDYVRAGRRSVDDPQCTRCGTCADVCLRRVLRLGFGGYRRT